MVVKSAQQVFVELLKNELASSARFHCCQSVQDKVHQSPSGQVPTHSQLTDKVLRPRRSTAPFWSLADPLINAEDLLVDDNPLLLADALDLEFCFQLSLVEFCFQLLCLEFLNIICGPSCFSVSLLFFKL